MWIACRYCLVSDVLETALSSPASLQITCCRLSCKAHGFATHSSTCHKTAQRGTAQKVCWADSEAKLGTPFGTVTADFSTVNHQWFTVLKTKSSSNVVLQLCFISFAAQPLLYANKKQGLHMPYKVAVVKLCTHLCFGHCGGQHQALLSSSNELLKQYAQAVEDCIPQMVTHALTGCSAPNGQCKQIQYHW